MTYMRLLVGVVDDGVTQVYSVQRFERIGDVEIGPIPVAEFTCLSFRCPDTDQWQREVIEHVREHL